MFRTVKKMHEDLDLLIDKVATSRWEKDERDRVLNFAQDLIIQERYDDFKQNKVYSFQYNQRIRDELRPIVVEDKSLTVTDKSIVLPDDYRHLILMELLMKGETKRVTSVSTTYNELGIIQDNPFSNPTKDFPKHIENENGVTFKTGDTDITSAFIYYIRDPVEIEFGDEIINKVSQSLTITNLIAGLTYKVIALFDTIPPGVTYKNVFYPEGSTFFVDPSSLTAFLLGFTTIQAGNDSELPGHLHDEIINKAASRLQGITEDYNQSNLLEAEARKS